MDGITSAGGVISVMRDGVCYVQVLEYATGRIAFAKGRQDPGETLEETALREVEEETGLAGLQIVQKLGSVTYRSDNPAQSMHEKTMHIFLMTATKRVHEGEDPWLWMPLEKAMTVMELPGERALLTEHEAAIMEHVSPADLYVV